jgi:ABC-type multidrug transport system fused ATPase/permease subunit
VKNSQRWLSCVMALVLWGTSSLMAQESQSDPNVPTNTVPAEKSPEDIVKENAEAAQKKVEDIAREVDKSPQAKEISAGILQPIYQLAEQLSFPFFHWVAFAVMATGVVSYALQLVLGKLVVLTKMGFSLSEILSDAHGLVISLVGLVLTTQAAAENSSFTQSPFAVISAAAVGVVVGFVFYLWGQAQEVQAAKARGMMPAMK